MIVRMFWLSSFDVPLNSTRRDVLLHLRNHSSPFGHTVKCTEVAFYVLQMNINGLHPIAGRFSISLK